MIPVVGCAIARKISKETRKEICHGRAYGVLGWSDDDGKLFAVTEHTTLSPVQVAGAAIGHIGVQHASKPKPTRHE